MAKMRQRLLVLCGGLFVFSCLLPLQETDASLITYNFESNVRDIFGTVFDSPHPFSLGQTLTGTFTYDTGTLDLNLADPSIATYDGAITNLDFETSTYSATGTAYNGSSISILNNMSLVRAGGFYDQVQLNISATGPSVNGANLTDFTIRLRDDSALAVENDLLGVLPSLSAFQIKNISFKFSTSGAPLLGGFVQAELTALTPAPVPLPAAAVLFPTGLSLLAITFRRLRNRKSH